jgi:TRAP-type mannitol/chloroaromatic compound transport system permease small subunit
MRNVLRWFDRLNEVASNSVSLLFAPMAVTSVYEVFMRYVMSQPTTWVWDVNLHCFALIVALGAGHTLLKGGHVVMDVITSRLPERTRLILRVVAFAVFVLAVGIIARQTALFAWRSAQIAERSSTILDIPVFPTKLAMAVGVLLLWLQGTSLFVKDLLALTSRGGLADMAVVTAPERQ